MSSGLVFVFEVRRNFMSLLLFCFQFLGAIRVNIMAPFRWPKMDQDIALCKEIIARRPMKVDDWENIGEFLSNLFTTENNPVQLKGRGCREQSELLVKKYKSEEWKALKR